MSSLNEGIDGVIYSRLFVKKSAQSLYEKRKLHGCSKKKFIPRR